MSTWCSKHVGAWNKLIVKQKFCASSWLIIEINIVRCTISKTYKKVAMLLYVCWKWNATVTRHDSLELLFSQWRKQMGEGPAEQKARMLRHNCDQWRIPWPLTRTQVTEVRRTYFRITSQKRYQSYNLVCNWNSGSKTLVTNLAPS